MKYKVKNKKWRTVISCLLILTMLMSFMPVFPMKVQAAATLGTNLLRAGDAEIGNGAQMSAGGWTGDNINSFYAYSSFAGVSPHGGNCYMGFYSSGPDFTFTRTTWQDIDISALATDINAGTIIANFSGYILRSGATSGDTVIQVQQLDQYGSVLGVASTGRYGSSSGWKNIAFTDAVLPNTVKIRIQTTGENFCNGFAAFDDLSLVLTGNVSAAPTVTSVDNQDIVSGASTGALALTVADADTAAGTLTLTGVSSNQTLIPNSNIAFGGSGADRTVNVTAQTAQSGTATITVAVSDGTKKGYMSFLVTVSPNAQINSELVVNGAGNSVAGWQGETSRYLLGSCFSVGSVPGGENATSDISQDINIGKFSSLVDTGLLQYDASAITTGTGAFRFEGYDEWNSKIWSISTNQVNTLLPAHTRLIRVTVGGKVGATIKNVSFKIPNSNLPVMTPVSNQEITAGGVATSSCTVAYEGNSVALTAESSNPSIIPSGNVVITGSGYQKTIKATALANTSGMVSITIKAGTKSLGSYSVNVKSVPNAPTGVTVVGGDSEATVSFTPSTDNGGGSISEYVVTSSPGNITSSGSGSPIRITGLTNGTTYTFTVKARNEIGYSQASAASDSLTLISEPKAPTSVTATPQDQGAVVAFSAPSSDGGTPITAYTVTANPGGKTVTGTASPLTVGELTNGTAYTFTVTATNGKGTGPASIASTAVTPRTVPGIPQNVQAQWGDKSAEISFTAPDNGGNSIKSYTVTAMPGNITAVGSASPIKVLGLTNGISYTFSVKATNDAGEGASSDGTVGTTPKTVPGKPTGVTGASGNGSVVVSFIAPSSNGGSEITSYTVVSSPGNFTKTSSEASITVDGLTNGTVYTFKVTATNSAGTSEASDSSLPIIPKTIPEKPTNITATPGDGIAIVGFDPPGNNGGSVITGYTVISTPGNYTATGATGTITVTGLTNGVFYTFKVKATNEVGDSLASEASASIMPDTPNYTISYEKNGGTGTAPVETTKKEGATFTTKLCQITPPTGMQFKEWNIKSDGTGTAYKEKSAVMVGTENITLYAIWEIIPEVVSVAVTPGLTVVDKGSTQQLIVDVKVKGTATDNVVWSSSDTSGMVSVDGTGLVTISPTAISKVYIITATSSFDPEKKSTANIQVAPSLAPYEEIKSKVKQTDYFSDSWTTYALVLAGNTVTRVNSQEEVDNAVKVIREAQKTLVPYPYVKDIKDSNVLIIGEYAFVLGDASYNSINYRIAYAQKYINPVTSKVEIYYYAGGKWYDLIKNEGKGLVESIDPAQINGDGRYTYWNMVELRP